MIETKFFLDDNSPASVTVHQVSDDPKGTWLIYPDQPSFLADGRRFVVHTSTGAAICDPDDNCSLRPLFPNGERNGDITLSSDGKYAFYRNCPKDDPDRLVVFRLDLDTLRREEVFGAEGTVPGTQLSAGSFVVNSISSDNQRVASRSWLGDGRTPDAPYGIIVLDLGLGTADVAAEHVDFHNPHLQYCRSTDPDANHDLMIQMCHGSHIDKDGKLLVGLGGPSELGVDVHIVRDDGSNWRDLPFGRDGRESCIGHQLWRGLGTSAVTVTLQNEDNSYGWADGSQQGVVAGWPAPADIDGPHRGINTPGTRRTVLSRGFERPRFCHLATDASGLRFVFDTFPIFDGHRAGMLIYVGSAPDDETPLTFRYLLNTGVTFNAATGYHAHPILSPDGSMLLFNSNFTGIPHAYLVREYEN